MNLTRKANDRVDITIEMKDEEITWKELMCYIIDAVKAQGYVSDELNRMQEEYMEDIKPYE